MNIFLILMCILIFITILSIVYFLFFKKKKKKKNIEEEEVDDFIEKIEEDIIRYYRYPYYDGTSTFLKKYSILSVPYYKYERNVIIPKMNKSLTCKVNKSGNWIEDPNVRESSDVTGLFHIDIKYNGMINNLHNFSIYLLQKDKSLIRGYIRIFLNKMFEYLGHDIEYPLLQGITLIDSSKLPLEDSIVLDLGLEGKKKYSHEIFDFVEKYVKLCNFNLSIKPNFIYDKNKYYQITTGIVFVDILSSNYNYKNHPDNDLTAEDIYQQADKFINIDEFINVQRNNKNVIFENKKGIETYSIDTRDNLMINQNILNDVIYF